MIEMFSEALRHALYTLNCTVLPPTFCDWLFNSDVENQDFGECAGDLARLMCDNPQDEIHITGLTAVSQALATRVLPPPSDAGFAFSQRSSNQRLIADETFNESDIINNLIYYEDGQEEPDSLRADKNIQESSFPTNWRSIFLK
ncbi:hypothetical protein TNCV_1622791 [Trichonephila clavipes]|nr:hypothetical protein TNCV_1622791 [Trichonephila clavipes]